MYPELTQSSHEAVHFFSDPALKLNAVIAIHSTALGPAIGGARIMQYAEPDLALEDALRLSEGMTFKNALADIPFGGAKACMIEPDNLAKNRTAIMLRFAEWVESLGGQYITAEDLGTTVDDVMLMRQVTRYAACRAKESGGAGDPSPWTCIGVVQGMRAACKFAFGSESLKGKVVAIQGAGKTGTYLSEMLLAEGAKVIITDSNPLRASTLKLRLPVETVFPSEIYRIPCDIFAPCAVGQAISPQSLSKLQCPIIAGSANNQLADSSVAEIITKKGLIYCPDFAINAGGVIAAAGESLPGGWNEQWVKQRVLGIYDTILKILTTSRETSAFTEEIAKELARSKLQQAHLGKYQKTA